jgi:SOS-response transcriptional repressor LexA
MNNNQKIVEFPTPSDMLIANLRRLMHEAHLSDAELSRRTKISQATLHKILTAKTEDPRASTLKILADFFNTSIDELLTGSATINIEKSDSNIQSVPIISWQDCCDPIKFTMNLTPTNWDKWVVSEFLAKHAYALASKPAIESRFPKGTVLFIVPDLEPKDGDHVVVLYPNTTEATLRELSTDGPSKLLLPIGSNASPTELDENIKMLGVLAKTSFLYANG